MGFGEDHLIPLVDDGLGDSAYLVDLGDGRALAVDASRDLRALVWQSYKIGDERLAGHLAGGITVLDGGPADYAAVHGLRLDGGDQW